MTTPTAFGTEFLVNTSTFGFQGQPALAALANGRFVVLWTDRSLAAPDSSGGAVRGQVFNADGSRAGGEFVVNATTARDQGLPAVTALDDGRFVATWDDDSQTGADTQDYAVRGQVFAPDGSRSGGEFVVNTTAAAQQVRSTVAPLDGGGFVVAWSCFAHPGDDNAGWAMRTQRFDATGAKTGGELLVNTATAGDQDQGAAARLAGGATVLVWTDGSGALADGSGPAVFGQRFAADGTPAGGNFLVNGTLGGAQTTPAVAGLAGGGFVVAWTDASQSGDDTSGSAVRAGLFNAAGTPLADDFVVATTRTDAQSDPAVAALPDGRFVVAWVDASQTGGDTSGAAIRAQAFAADGAKSGGEFLVNTIVTGDQTQPAIATLADGRLVIGWTDASQSPGDTINAAVRAQIFDPRLAAVALVGTAAGDDLIGTGWGDRLAGAGGADRLAGAGGDDRLLGGVGGDVLHGGGGADLIKGQGGNDEIAGGGGRDVLIGGKGADRFVFLARSDSGRTDAKSDFVEDFRAGADRVDLSAIDAGAAAGDQAFDFIGKAGFHGTEGELRAALRKGATLLLGDIDGDARADFRITFDGRIAFDADDFVL